MHKIGIDNMTNSIIIFGSARSKGHTYDAVKKVLDKIPNIPVIDIAKYQISEFDYEYRNKNDDFMKIIDKALEYDRLILATPVYWYTMSTMMKRFVDRLSDLTSIYKDKGRLLRGKDLAIISSYSVYPEGKNGFEEIFVNTANYLEMNYIGCYFHYSGDDESILLKNDHLAKEFINQLNKEPSYL